MGRLPTGNRKYHIQDLWSAHHEILRMLLLGMKEVDIAAALNVTPAMVSYTKNSAIGKRQLNIMQGARDAHTMNVAVRIKELAPKAVEVLETQMDSETERIAQVAALSILDRAGYAPVQRLQAETVHMHFTSDELKDIKARAKAIIDIQPTTMLEAAG